VALGYRLVLVFAGRFGAQLPAVRTMWPKSKLRSDVYWKLIAANRKYRFAEKLDALRRRPPRESVVQDIEIPVDRLPEFLDFFHAKIGINRFGFAHLNSAIRMLAGHSTSFNPNELYVNVGFWSTVPLVHGEKPEDGVKNRQIETKSLPNWADENPYTQRRSTTRMNFGRSTVVKIMNTSRKSTTHRGDSWVSTRRW